jgi:acyl-[acyl-carrier-protein] desaturase
MFQGQESEFQVVYTDAMSGMTSAEIGLHNDLTPIMEGLFDRHVEKSKLWYPHEMFDIQDLPKRPKEPVLILGRDAVASALFVNLLTEDNLPYYFQTIDRMFSNAGVWGEWSRRWTAEENRHSTAIRDAIVHGHTFDLYELEKARMAQMSKGEVPQPESYIDGMVYVSLQELATRVAHANTRLELRRCAGKDERLVISRDLGSKVLSHTVIDESNHGDLYGDLTAAALTMQPGLMLPAILRVISEFAMPGTGIVDFEKHTKIIAAAGIYSLNHFVRDVVKPTVYGRWHIDTMSGLSDADEEVRQKILAKVSRLEKLAARLSPKTGATISS